MSKGYVYIFSNEFMPGLVKIGRTIRSVNDRANELYQTGVPGPFKVESEVLAPNCEALESYVHGALSEHRVNTGREFFKCSRWQASGVLEDGLREQVEEWLEEFIPDSIIEDADYHIDLGAFEPEVYEAARRLEIVPPDFPQVLYRLSAEAFEEAALRLRDAREKRKCETQALRVVGDE